MLEISQTLNFLFGIAVLQYAVFVNDFEWFSLGTPVSSTNKTDRPYYKCNIVESGIKHHKPYPQCTVQFRFSWLKQKANILSKW